MTPRLAYCTNVHAGADLAATIANLELHAARVRDLVAPGRTLGIGLWLSARAAADLALRDDVRRLGDRLRSLGLVAVTMNGFPFGDFHQTRVKHAVYEPHWASPERLAYTRALARILVDLVPDGTSTASISTLPIGWRSHFTSDGCAARLGIAAAQLSTVAGDLRRLEDETGVRITVDLEPEPGCLLDRADDVVRLFEQCFNSEVERRHLGVCHDVCHAAVMFERQADVIAAYRRANVNVNKVQVSSAVEADGSPSSLSALREFAEDRYLHQTCVRDVRGDVAFFEDLPDALAAPRSDTERSTWRTHFHVPIHLSRLPSLATTQADIVECLAALDDDRTVLEIETYAWSVLPESLRPRELAEGIGQEYRWLEKLLQ